MVTYSASGPIQFGNPLNTIWRTFERKASRISLGPAWSTSHFAAIEPTETRAEQQWDLTPFARDKLLENAQTILALLELEPAWDGSRGKPLSVEAAGVAVQILIDVIPIERPSPQLVPLPSGGIQIEWHVAGNDLEIEIDAKGELHILAVTVDDETVIDREVSPVFLDLAMSEARRFLRRMSALLQEAS